MDELNELRAEAGKLDAVVHCLGIEDSHEEPADIVRQIQGQLDELKSAARAMLETTPAERQNPAIWYPRVDRLKAAIDRANRRTGTAQEQPKAVEAEANEIGT